MHTAAFARTHYIFNLLSRLTWLYLHWRFQFIKLLAAGLAGLTAFLWLHLLLTLRGIAAPIHCRGVVRWLRGARPAEAGGPAWVGL